MRDFFRRLRVRDLVATWAVYWLVLSLQLIPLAEAIWRATQAGTGKGEVTASIADWVCSVTVKLAGAPIYTASRHLLGLALIVAGPPMALWLLWVATRPRPVESREPV